MFSAYVPTFLAGWELPSLSAAAHLSAALQRRVLSFLLRRTLGHLVKPGQLDSAQIEAGIGSGRVEIRNLELDEDVSCEVEAFNAFAVNLPLAVRSGRVGKIAIQLPWPNLWSGELSVSISEVRLQCIVAGDGDASLSSDAEYPDLASSIISNADDIMEQDEEGRQLRESISQCLESNDGAQEVSEADSQLHPSSVVSTIVEALLRRLSISVADSCVTLSDEKSGTDVDLRVGRFTFITESGTTEQVDSVAVSRTAADDHDLRITTRTIRLSDFSVWLNERTPRGTHSRAQASSSSRSTSPSTRHSSPRGSLFMSQAVPDLVRSELSEADTSKSASMYASATEDSRAFLKDESTNSPRKIISSLNEDMIFSLTTAKSITKADDTTTRPPSLGGNASMLPQQLESTLTINLGTLAALLDVKALSAIAKLLTNIQIEGAPQESAKLKPTRARSSLAVTFHLKGFHLLCISDLQVHPTLLREFMSAFWSQSALADTRVGHIRVRLTDLKADIAVSGDSEHSFNASLSLGDLALYECLTLLRTASQAQLLPLLIFDRSLLQHCHRPTSLSDTSWKQQSDYTVEAIDWRAATAASAHDKIVESPYTSSGCEETDWKLRTREGSSGKEGTTATMHPCLALTYSIAPLDQSAHLEATLQPMHVFADLSLANRLLPLARMLVSKTPSGSRTQIPVHDDLLASVATIQEVQRIQVSKLRPEDLDDGYSQRGRSTKAPSISLTCTLIRLEARVPATPHPSRLLSPTKEQRENLRSGLDNRAGIVVVDIHSFALTTFSKTVKEARHTGWSAPRRPSVEMKLTVQEIAVHLCPPGQILAVRVATIRSSRQSHEWPQEPPISPSLSVAKGPSGQLTGATAVLPSVHVKLSKLQLDALLILVDDCSKWSGALKLHGDDLGASAVDITAPLNLIGSRILGLHLTPSSAGSVTSVETATGLTQTRPSLVLAVNDVHIDLVLQRSEDRHEHRRLRIASSDINLTVSKVHLPNSLYLSVQAHSVTAQEILRDDIAFELLGRTEPLTLVRKSSPMLTITFQSAFGGSSVDVTLRSTTIVISPDITSFVEDLRRLLGAPEGTFENVEPSDQTRLSLKVRDVSILIRSASPPTVSCKRAVLTLAKVGLRTKLHPEALVNTIRFAGESIGILLTDGSVGLQPTASIPRHLSLAEAWQQLTFVPILDVSAVRGSITTKVTRNPAVEVSVDRMVARILACADTMQVLVEFVTTFLISLQAVSETGVDLESSAVASSLQSVVLEERSPDNHNSDRDMLVSLDEHAFRGQRIDPMDASIPDLVEDDVPANLTFLGERDEDDLGGSRVVEAPLDGSEFFGSESVASLALTARTNKGDDVVLETETVTVRLFDAEGLAPTEDFFSNPQLLPAQTSALNLSSQAKVHVTNVDLSLGLYGGYDWSSTRCAIEEEARAVRRRLQKIKQLVASGQTPDDSIEQATRGLFESIHITLPTSHADMNADALMQALDDEIGDDDRSQSDASESLAASQTSSAWEPLQAKGRPRAGQTGGTSLRAGRQRKLQRSKKSLIDFELRNLSAEYNSYAKDSPLVSRVAVDVGTLQIIDDVPTSTWRTFLTAMSPDGPSYQRDSVDSKMVRVEVRELSSTAGKSEGQRESDADIEVRMRAKVAPLRLHVDQDALDFVKKFFTFRAPGSAPEQSLAKKQSRPQPFIQHAEIYPIRLKLDYKPKRVDYGILRAGQTIELMNFFHFDGAEMTLRHVTLRGISGWPRLFETLNDVWTPDVKANQLADVLAGVAPIRTLVNVGAGVADLVLLPIEQYQKDGRIFRGIQKGANSFAKSTAVEAVKFGARLATGTQVFLERAEHVLGGRIDRPLQGSVVDPVLEAKIQKTRGMSSLEDELRTAQADSADNESGGGDIAMYSKFSQQPEDMREALSDAYRGLSQGLHSAAQTILAVPMEVYERGSGGDGASGSHPVVRAVPIAVLRGAVGASEAISKTLMGMRNVLEPNAQSEVEDKYKRR